MSNEKTFIVAPNNTGDRKWLLVRPTSFSWDDIVYTTIRPLLGQPIRIRESMTVFFERSGFTSGSMFWENRYQSEHFIGHYQVTRNAEDSPNSPKVITERGQVIGSSDNSEFSKWTFQREYNLNIYLNSEDSNAAAITAISNCNADLAPGAVKNRYITPANAAQYAQLAYGLATGNLVNFTSLLTKLASPTIDGYKFPDSVLFKAQTEIPTITLSGKTITTELGDIGLWVHPDWMVRSEANYTFQVINYKVANKLSNQYPFVDTCTYPAADLSFP